MEEPEDNLTETERITQERKLLERAYENSFNVLTNRVTFDELLDVGVASGVSAILTFDPTRGPKKYELENMIEFYEEDEWFERCGEIMKILNKRFPGE